MATALLVIIYVAFISLGLPDSLLGAAWPSMYASLGVPISSAGMVSMIVAGGTIVSSLCSARVIRRFGTGRVTAVSVGMTAAALLGFAFAPNFIWLCLCAVPLGLGAGSVDAALNNFVALHYQARHMSWLHCFWGLGATAGPLVMAACIGTAGNWPSGFQTIGLLQAILVAVLVFTLPLWGKVEKGTIAPEKTREAAKGMALLRIPGAVEAMLTFTCYCGIESMAGLWASSYLVMHCGFTADSAAQWASAFFLGITLARFLCGFLTMRLQSKTLIRLGQCVIAVGVVTLLLPLPQAWGGTGFFLVGLGCAPIYPSLIHETPAHFGAENSQALMGLQMASAYVGSTFVPPLFGLIAQYADISWMPYCMGAVLVVQILLSERLNRKTPHAA